MAPELQAVTHAAQSWLQSSWNIQVPSAWLEACVEWLQEEAGGPGRLVQQQVNQQVSWTSPLDIFVSVSYMGTDG